ncbi:MAG: hypothetical protein ABIG69_07710 [Bacteroidota bacterium]
MKLDLIVYMAIIVVAASGSALLLFSLVASKVSIRNRKTNYRTDQNDHLLNHQSMFAKLHEEQLAKSDKHRVINKHSNSSGSADKSLKGNSYYTHASKRMQVLTPNQ